MMLAQILVLIAFLAQTSFGEAQSSQNPFVDDRCTLYGCYLISCGKADTASMITNPNECLSYNQTEIRCKRAPWATCRWNEKDQNCSWKLESSYDHCVNQTLNELDVV
ncbi:hypothetical protein BKA69DRAFT_107475 [Paraphysoderma sedebokerense]|nr:hypothetical protein BKA69DRAFT_107475 [Paraphysoderma sedebokerense]